MRRATPHLRGKFGKGSIHPSEMELIKDEKSGTKIWQVWVNVV